MTDLYTIKKIAEEENQYIFSFVLNANHCIFKGHFPEQAVLPGVCQLEIVQSVLSFVKPNYSLCKAKSIKFLKIIEPQEQEFSVLIKIKEANELKVTASIYDAENTYLKANLTLT